MDVCSGRFHCSQGRERQRWRQNDKDNSADKTDAISHDRQLNEQVHQNADHCIHQPDQRREGDDSGIIQGLIRLQCKEVVRCTRFLFGLESYRFVLFGACEATSSWKRGSFRSGSNIESSRSNAGVSGTPEASGPSYGIESSFCKAAIARSGSPTCAATRARISIGSGPSTASFLIGFAAIARSTSANAAALSPMPILVSARSPMRR